MKAASMEKAREWFSDGDTGTSSETIWHVMTGFPVKRVGVPYDPSDFGRCHRLLQKFPRWRKRMGEVADAYPNWRTLVREWDSLTALYVEEEPTGNAPKLYRRMKELLCDAGVYSCTPDKHVCGNRVHVSWSK